MTEILRPDATLAEGIYSLHNSTHHGAVSDQSDSTYVYTGGAFPANIAWQKDIYGIQNHSVGVGVINKITILFRASQAWTNENSGHAIGFIYDPATATYHDGLTKDLPQNGDVAEYSDDWTTNPITSIAWTWDDIDNLQAGINLKQDLAAYNTYCHEFWIVVDYTLPTFIPKTMVY